MSDYRATPEQWADAGAFASDIRACLLELCARVEALEANTKQWRIDHLRLANTCASLAPDRLSFFNALLPDDEDSKPTPNPSQIRSSPLVERVADALCHAQLDSPSWEPEARAAIREVAAWIEETQHDHWSAVSRILRFELDYPTPNPPPSEP